MNKKGAKAAAKPGPRKKLTTKRKSPDRSGNQNFPVVGIGASAGGVEASSQLLKNLPTDLGMAYVFVHHLSAAYDSNLPEIFQRNTSLPVEKVRHNMEIAANHVYVIPPNTWMRIEAGCFKLKKRSALDTTYHPVDYFFMSLADAYLQRAIGVILSGTASDGTLGAEAIKEKGGIMFAQDETAAHIEMPRNAFQAGFIDIVLSPPRIAQELASLKGHPYTADIPQKEELKNHEGIIKRILEILLQAKGVDFFSHYKRSTIYRRVMRRMALHKIFQPEVYLKKLKKDPREVTALYQDFLINVTSFFREPAFFNALVKTVFPKLVKDRKPVDPLRIWIAGCATGEEAYSMAICLTAFLQKKKLSHPVNIFATDLNGKAIEKARLGIYPKHLVQHLSAQRIKTFFKKIDGHYQVVKSIREQCIFSQHDLLRDPPFSRIDLISCQNVLIYLEGQPQKRVLQTFHYALKPSGFMLIGKSESIGSASELFSPYAKESRLFVRKSVAVPRLQFGSPLHRISQTTLHERGGYLADNDVEKESDKMLLARYVPASVLVNKDLEIIRFRGPVAAYLEPASGKASLNLLKMVKDELLFELRGVLSEAKKSGLVATREHISIDQKPNGVAVTLEVAPLKSGKEVYYLVVFKEGIEEPPLHKRGPASRPSADKVRTQKLEQALVNAREQLRAINEDFETTREELQTANEEVVSSNEELQSINEELETSKEELQSSNEELTTVNDELLNRNVELQQSRDYAEAIIETIRGPLMVLNPEMRIRTANRAFYDFFQISKEETEGVLFYDLLNYHWNVPALLDKLRDIFPDNLHFEGFEISHDFPRIGYRAMIVNAHKLVRKPEDKESLILLSFEDITRYKKAEKSLKETQEQLELALMGGKVITWSWNIRNNKIQLSKEGLALYGLSSVSGFQTYDEWEQLVYPEDVATIRKMLNESMERKLPIDSEFRIVMPDKSIRWILLKAQAYDNQDGAPETISGVQIDITQRHNAQEVLEESEKRFHTMSDHAPVMIWMADADGKCNFLNKTWLSFRGKPLEAECNDGWLSGIHPDDRSAFMDVYQMAVQERREFKVDCRFRSHNGTYRWMMNHGVPRFAGNEKFMGFIGTCTDITDRIDLERQKDDFMSIASHELKTPVSSIKAYAQILQQKFQDADDPVSANMLSRLDSQIDKLTGLINTLLDVAKFQSGQMDYHEESFEIDDLIREVSEEMQNADPGHTIVTDLRANRKVWADKERMTQVLTNLVSNALKYSPPSTKVVVQSVHDDEQSIVSVQDFGVGISRDMQDKIFGRFFRVSESAGNRVSGLGLGLFISSRIIKQHGGELWLESEPGKGSKFYFSLPDKAG